jgi:26S proteasome regulatory subunit N1
MAAVACGMISIGTCNVEVTSSILQAMMEQSETQVKDTYARFLALGLGLTFLGKTPISIYLRTIYLRTM